MVLLVLNGCVSINKSLNLKKGESIFIGKKQKTCLLMGTAKLLLLVLIKIKLAYASLILITNLIIWLIKCKFYESKSKKIEFNSFK